MPTDSPTIFLANAAVTAGAWNDLQIVVWRSSSTLPVLREVVRGQQAAIAARPARKIAVLTVLDAGSIALPDAAMRAVIDDHRRVTHDAHKVEVIVLPSGFVAATIRSFMAGITLLRKPAYPTRVTASLDEASEYIAPMLEPTAGRVPTGAQVREVVAMMRSAPRA